MSFGVHTRKPTPFIDVIASRQNNIDKWQLWQNVPRCAKGEALCIKKINTFGEKSPNQGWQNDKEHLGRDNKKKDQNDSAVGG